MLAAAAAPALSWPCIGKKTVNTLYGTRVAVLAGDFLFAQASWLIANLENLEVCASRFSIARAAVSCLGLAAGSGTFASKMQNVLLLFAPTAANSSTGQLVNV